MPILWTRANNIYINRDDIESNSIIVDASYLENSESKSVQISVNSRKVKYAKNESVNTSRIKNPKIEIKDEQPSVTDNSVTNAPIHFKLFEYDRFFLNKLDAICEQPCMANLENKYYTEFYNIIKNYSERNNIPLSNKNII